MLESVFRPVENPFNERFRRGSAIGVAPYVHLRSHNHGLIPLLVSAHLQFLLHFLYRLGECGAIIFSVCCVPGASHNGSIS